MNTDAAGARSAAPAVALGTADAVSDAAHQRLGLDGTGRRPPTAAVRRVIAVPLIVFLRRRVDRPPWTGWA
ncbi:hypothetical protein [Actinomadura keratinilytica]|jgi:hypothetical protein|uniref:Uncharacterized protein n=1 Tax=Actinomadura keratinilytica TaxID=547461 RepID=A0ABP7Z903_9ACTN